MRATIIIITLPSVHPFAGLFSSYYDINIRINILTCLFKFLKFSVANVVDDTLFGSPAPVDPSTCPVRLYVLNDVTKLQQYQGESVNIAVVYSNYPSVYLKVFYDGVFFKSIPINPVLFSSLGNTTAYLGRSKTTNSGAGTGLDIQFEEFRIYFGELSKDDAQTLFLVGTDPSHLTVSSEKTVSDIWITFYSTSLVDVNIQFYGGSTGPSNSSLQDVDTSYVFKMFGGETSFQLYPEDQQCAYRPMFNLDPETSSTQVKVPAMNYTVTLLDSTLPAPQFSNTSCPSGQTPCFCGESKSPYQYMTDANLLNQSFIVTEVNDTLSVFQYYYHTGLCYEVIGSEKFSLVEGQPNNDGDSCFPNDVFYMNKTDGSALKSKNVTIVLFERYPEGVNWFAANNQNKYVATAWTDQPMVNWFIENSTLSVFDQVSGSNSNVVFDYNTTLVKSCDSCHTAIAIGFVYTLTANYAYPSFPYDLQFEIYAKRSGNDGTFTVDNIWYIPVLGVVSKEVPNFYPVSSDPNLIFLIIRDPPGGTSTTTIQAGTTFQVGISIDNMQTFDTVITTTDTAELGAQSKMAVGLGVLPILQQGMTSASTNSLGLTISTAFGSTSTHDYSFYFESDFSTSDDPNIAGHPSDVIIGGGIDISVAEATQGKIHS